MTSFRFLKRFRADQDGVTAVEFGLIGPGLIFLIMGISETMLALAAQNVLENATFVGARVTKTGYIDAKKSQKETIEAAIKTAAEGYLDISKIVVTSTVYADFDKVGEPEPFTDKNKNGKWDKDESFVDVNGNGKYDIDQGASGSGAGGQIVVFTATYPWKIYTPLISEFLGKNGVIDLSAKAVVKNEPF